MSEWQETRKELPSALAALIGMTVLAAIGGFFISLPHSGDWAAEWFRYTLWLMVGIPIVTAFFGAAVADMAPGQESPYPYLMSVATWVYWALSVANLIGSLINPELSIQTLKYQAIATGLGIVTIIWFIVWGLAQDEKYSST